MSRPTVDSDKDSFLAALVQVGGSSGNQGLRQKLAWSEDRYWRTHGLLTDAGQIVRGRGKCGSVSLVESEEEVAEVPLQTSGAPASGSLAGAADADLPERELYEPAKIVIEETWVRERAFDDHLVEVTASPGRRSTGGTWTRPDIAVLATKAYPYLPDRVFEIITFEIKPADAVNVTGVFEALSHSQFAIQSYALFNTGGRDFDKYFKDTQRVLALATQHGVGVIIANDISQYASWDERVRPRRNLPDPEQANLFISSSFSEAAKQRVVKWHK